MKKTAGVTSLWVAFLSVLLAACRSAPEPPAPARAPNEPPGAARADRADVPTALRYVGEVVRVAEDHGYVIVECLELPPAGQALEAVRDREIVGSLRAEGERRPPFIAATIQSGAPRQGDRVVRTETNAEPDGGGDE